tara:strand:+ start:481 stop:588 length:108 start_codon:yes stop_codon:yes gene_type:complete
MQEQQKEQENQSLVNFDAKFLIFAVSIYLLTSTNK